MSLQLYYNLNFKILFQFCVTHPTIQIHGLIVENEFCFLHIDCFFVNLLLFQIMQ